MRSIRLPELGSKRIYNSRKIFYALVTTALLIVNFGTISPSSFTHLAQAQTLTAPTGVSASSVSNSRVVTVSWNAVTGADYYRIAWVPTPDDSDNVITWDLERFNLVENTGQTSHTVANLRPGAGYQFNVASIDEDNPQPNWATTPAALTLASDALYYLLFDDATAALSWDAVGGATRYRIGWIAVDDIDAAIQSGNTQWQRLLNYIEVLNPDETSIVVDGLKPGEHYFTVASSSTQYGRITAPSSYTSITALSLWQTIDVHSEFEDDTLETALEGIFGAIGVEVLDLDDDACYQIDIPDESPGALLDLRLDDDTSVDERIVPYLCRDDDDENYWIFSPSAYTDAQTIEKIAGRAFEEFDEFDNRVDAYKSVILELAIQQAQWNRNNEDLYVHSLVVSKDVLASAEKTAEITDAVIKAYELESTLDGGGVEVLDAHIGHLLGSTQYLAVFGTAYANIAISSAVNRTIDIAAARDYLDVMSRLNMDSAWQDAIDQAHQELDDMTSNDELRNWKVALDQNMDDIVLKVSKVLATKAAAKATTVVAAKVVGAKLALAGGPITIAVGITASVGYHFFEKNRGFWNEIGRATVAAQVFWHTSRLRLPVGSKSERLRQQLLRYYAFSFYQHLYLSAEKLTGPDLTFGAGQVTPEDSIEDLLDYRDTALKSLIGGQWDLEEDFKFQNIDPNGIWSDDSIMFVADNLSRRVYRFNLLSKSAPTSDPYFSLRFGSDPIDPISTLWSNGSIIWVGGIRLASGRGESLRAYDLSTSDYERVTDRDIDLGSNNNHPVGIWSEGATLWVADSDERIYAHDLSDERNLTRVLESEFDALKAVGNNAPAGIWSDDNTMWVADKDDDRLYAYNMDTFNRDLLREIPLINIPDVLENTDPADIWSDGTTMWVADSNAKRIFAYDLPQPGEDEEPPALPFARNYADDFGRLIPAGNHDPEGIWANETTMWVLDNEDEQVYAYDFETKARDDTKDIDLDSSNSDAQDIWSDGDTMWVSDHGDDRIYAYDLTQTGSPRIASEEVSLHAGNTYPTGIYSNGAIMWVADHNDTIYAYDLTQTGFPRATDHEFDLTISNEVSLAADIGNLVVRCRLEPRHVPILQIGRRLPLRSFYFLLDGNLSSLPDHPEPRRLPLRFQPQRQR